MAITGNKKYKVGETDDRVDLFKTDSTQSSPDNPDFITFAKPTGSSESGYSGTNEYTKNLASYGMTDSNTYSPTGSTLSGSGSAGSGGSGFSFSGSKPGYFSSYAGQIDALLGQIMNRSDFSYDYTSDPLYEEYRDQYTREGNKAMRDTMGSAAALTGGYGNSYGTTAGSQAYQSYLGQLNEVVPELEQLAYQKYQDAQSDRYNQLSALSSLDNTEYNRYRDDVGDYYQDYANAYREYQDALSQENYEKEFAYQQGRDQVSDGQWQQEYELSAQEAARELAYKYAAAGLLYPYTDATTTWKDNALALGKSSGSGSSGRSGSSSGSAGKSSDTGSTSGFSRNYEVTLSNMKDYKSRGVSTEQIANTIVQQVANGTITGEEGEDIAYRVGVQNELLSAAQKDSALSKSTGNRSYKNQTTY